MPQSLYSGKKEIVEICKRIYQRGYVAANDGNVSLRIDNGHILLTPTGMSKGYLHPMDIAIVDIEGRQVAGKLRPSSEAKMHLTIYQSREDVNAVVHAHPPTATGFAVSGLPLTQCVLPEVIISVGSIPIAEYAAPGTQELAEVVVRYLEQYDAVLLENHGAITVGANLIAAHFKMETMEHFAKIMLVAHQLGNIHGLQPYQVEELLSQREKYGIRPTAPGCEIPGKGVKSPEGGARSKKDQPPAWLIEQITRQVIERMKNQDNR